MNTRALYTELVGKIHRVRRKENNVTLQTAVLNTLAAVISIWTVAITLEAIVGFGIDGRTAIYWSAVALSGLAAAWLMAIPFGRFLGVLRSQEDDLIARRVGLGIPEIGDRLVNTLQLYRSADGTVAALGYSPELVEASIWSEGEPLRHYDYTVIIQRDERRRALLFFISSVVLLSGLFLGFPSAYGTAFERLTNYSTEYTIPATFTLSIEPSSRSIVRGDSVDVVVRAIGVPPRSVKLVVKGVSQKEGEEIELREDSTGAFRHRLVDLKETTTFYAYSGMVKSGERTITVVERPEIRSMTVTVTPPSYTGRRAETLPNNMGDVSGLRGTGVSVVVTTNIEPAKAHIVQLFPRTVRLASAATDVSVPTSYDTVRIAMRIEGTRVAGGFRLTRDGKYYVAITSREGLVNLSPVQYSMSVSTDGSPSIALIEPTGKAEVDEKMLLPTEVRISDDYGFSRLRLLYKLTASKYEAPWTEFKAMNIPIPRREGTSVDVPYIWDMTGLNMVPEDEMEIYFEVYDNDVVTGPKVARTGHVTVRFPSLEEVLKNAESMQQRATADLDNVLKQAQQAKQQMEELNRELLKQLAQSQKQSGWQEQQKLQQLMKQHEQMQQKLEEVAENLRTMAEKLKEAKAISPETLEKYQELQKLFEELKNPELMKRMQEMQEAMEKMTPEQMAEAMKNYKFNEENFRKSIERTMNILKRMQTEQKVDELIRRAEELEKQQQSVNEQMKEATDKAEQQQLSERQKDLAQKAEQLKKETEELSQKMEQQGDMPTKEMQDAQEQLEQNDPQQQMQDAAEQMEQGDMQQAQQQGEKAQQSAQDFKKKMQGVKQKMQENGKKEVMNKMKKSLQDLLELSKREEQIKQKTEDAQPNSGQFRDLAQQQQQAQQDLQNIANELGALSQKSFAITPEMGRELGDAMRQMSGATQSLENRDGFNAAQQEGQAMGSLNRAAMMMQQALSQMQGQQQGQGQGQGMGMGSFQQRLQQMAAQQQMINQAMQEGEGQQQGQGKKGKQGKDGKEGENGQGEGGDQAGGENGERMRRLQQQQGQVKKSLDDLNREAKENGGTRKNMVGDLERAAKEIEEVLRDMQSGSVTPETRQRQDRILSRLLDAVKSSRERDFEKQRESKSGVDVTRTSPPELKDQTPDALDRAQRDFLRGGDAAYTRDYEYMIRQYFESLGQPQSQQ